MYDNNGDTFIARPQKVILAPGLCNQLFSNIISMNLGHTCLFHIGFYKVYFENKRENAVTLPHSAKRKHEFLVKTK